MLTPENIVVLCACVYSASKLLIFATSTQKRILNPFLSLHYRLRVSSFVVSEWMLIMVFLIEDQQGNQRKKQVLRPAFFVEVTGRNYNSIKKE